MRYRFVQNGCGDNSHNPQMRKQLGRAPCLLLFKASVYLVLKEIKGYKKAYGNITPSISTLLTKIFRAEHESHEESVSNPPFGSGKR